VSISAAARSNVHHHIVTCPIIGSSQFPDDGVATLVSLALGMPCRLFVKSDCFVAEGKFNMVRDTDPKHVPLHTFLFRGNIVCFQGSKAR
jgi:hypothetical protein